MCLCVHDVCGMLAQDRYVQFFPFPWNVFWVKPRWSDLFAKSLCTLIFTLLFWKKCEMAVLFFFLSFPYCMFYFRIPCLAFAIIHGHVIKYSLSSFLWNKKKNNCVVLFLVLNKLSSKWGSSHLNEIFLLWGKVSRDSVEDYGEEMMVSPWVTGKGGTGQSRRRCLWFTIKNDGLDMHNGIFSLWKESHLNCGSRCPD